MGLLFFAKIGSGRSEDSDCVITGTYEKKGKKKFREVLFNCFKNLDQKMNDIYMLATSNTEMQIKGDSLLI